MEALHMQWGFERACKEWMGAPKACGRLWGAAAALGRCIGGSDCGDCDALQAGLF